LAQFFQYIICVSGGGIDAGPFQGAAKSTEGGHFKHDGLIGCLSYIDGGEVHAERGLGPVGKIDYLLSVRFNRGDILVLAAALIWALYSTNLRKYPKELHPLAYLSGIVITGLIALLPLYLIELYFVGGFTITGASLSTILYVAVFASVLAFIFWNRAVSMPCITCVE